MLHLDILADTHLDLDIQRKQVDDKVYHIERRFRSRESARYSGAADQSYWPLEDRVMAVCGKQNKKFLAVHKEIVHAILK